MPVKELVTPKQVARAIGVSESSLKRWCDDGRIPMIRTAGGHRRLPIHGVLKFLRESGHELVDPGVLGLPRTSGTGERVIERARTTLREALIAGDERIAQQVVVDLYLARIPVHQICDEIVSKAFEDIGELWSCEEVAVYQERRGCEIALRVLLELRALVTTSNPEGLKAIGGTIPDDNYVLPTTIVELVLRDAGWQATSLGNSLPFDSLALAVKDTKPDLFWLSVSYIATDEDAFVESFTRLHEAVTAAGATFVVGGRALDATLRERVPKDVHYCESFRDLHEFANNFGRSS